MVNKPTCFSASLTIRAYAPGPDAASPDCDPAGPPGPAEALEGGAAVAARAQTATAKNAAETMDQTRMTLECSSLGLLFFDRNEERLEVALAEREAPLALNQLEEERRPVLERLGEDLEHVTEVVTVDEDAEFA